MESDKVELIPLVFFAQNAQSAEPNTNALKGIKRWGSIPVVKDEIYFIIPDGFPMTASWDSNKPGLYQAAFYPDGQTKEDWKENLRLMAFQGIPSGNESPAKQMLNIVSQPAKSACPNDFFFIPTAQKNINRASAIMGCRKMGANAAMAVFGHYLVIQGEEGMYVLAREFRQSSFAGELPVSKPVQSQWLEQADRTTVCRRNEMCINKTDR